MKKTNAIIKRFLKKHYRLAFFILSALILSSGTSFVYTSVPEIPGICFAFSILAAFRVLGYRNGRPFLFREDVLWSNYKLKYSEDELEDRYKETCLNRAAVYFIISLAAIIVWIVAECLLFIVLR